MEDTKVSSTTAAKELNLGVLTLRELMKQDRLPIGYCIKKEGHKKSSFIIFRGLLDAYKKQIGIN